MKTLENTQEQLMSMRTFAALSSEDFDELAGSTWRARDRLAGLLAKSLKSTLKRPYQSWGVRRRLEVHIADQNHYSFDDPFPFPKLFVYSQKKLAFGFYIESPTDGAEPDELAKYGYWRSFKHRLQNDTHVSQVLLDAMGKHELTLADYYRQDKGGGVFGGNFTVRNGRIRFDSATNAESRDISTDEFIQRITDPHVKGRQWMDLHVFAELDKASAIEMKGEVATPILKVLLALAPLYEFSISASSPTG